MATNDIIRILRRYGSCIATDLARLANVNVNSTRTNLRRCLKWGEIIKIPRNAKKGDKTFLFSLKE